MRTIDWDGSSVVIIDQTRLPSEEVWLHLATIDELAEAIMSLRVRGAMALGVAGALGVALAIVRAQENSTDPTQAALDAARELRATRPTAVNLGWGIDQALAALDAGPQAAVNRAAALVEADVAANKSMSIRGAKHLIDELSPGPERLRIMTHCNAGSLAAVDWGSALGVVRALRDEGVVAEVLTCETRPLLQGARLTSWELFRLGIPHKVIVDGAAAGLIMTHEVDVVITGADRIAANGDVANKVGTVAHALAADRAGIPFVVAAPETTIDANSPTGSSIPIEERGADEVLGFAGTVHTDPRATARNPAFDVTPHDLVSAIVTDKRIVRPKLGERPVE